MIRRPLPYSRLAISHIVPSMRVSTARTSSRVSTTGRRFGTFACVTLSSQGNSTCNTSLYRNNSALLAWFCVEAETVRATAK